MFFKIIFIYITQCKITGVEEENITIEKSKIYITQCKITGSKTIF